MTGSLIFSILAFLYCVAVLEVVLAPLRNDLDPKECPMLHKVTVRVDTDDFLAIQSALLYRRDWNCVPDAEAGSTENGVLMAEICRGWMERCNYEWPHPQHDPSVTRIGGE